MASSWIGSPRLRATAVAAAAALSVAGLSGYEPSAATAAPTSSATHSPGATAGRVAAGHHTYSVRTLHFTVHVGPHRSQSCDVVGDLYRPARATARHREPAVLTTNGFGGSKDDQRQFAGELAGRGYVVLSYSGLGFGGSGCSITLDDPDYDGLAASELVDFLGGRRPASDGTRIHYVRRDHRGPVVGMLGGSYGGGIQFATVAADMARFGHSRVRAIVPIITWNDLPYSLAPNNAGLTGTAVDNTDVGAEKVQWVSALFGAGVADGAMGGSPSTCPGYPADFCGPALRLAATGYPDPGLTRILEHASVHSYVHKIHVPTMLMQGEHDSLFNLHESVATYRRLRAMGTPTKLVWQSWGHTDATPAPGEFGVIDKQFALEDPSGRLTFEGRLIEQWFAHYLKGAPEAPSLDFSFYRDWAQHGTSPAAARAAYGRSPSYPVGRRHTLRLAGTSLVPNGRRGGGTQRFLTPAAGAPAGVGETTALDPDAPPMDPSGTFAHYETAPLRADVDVVGVPTVRVRVSTSSVTTPAAAGPAGRLVLFFKIYDVAPDGTKTLPGGVVSATRIVPAAGPVSVSLPGIVHRFARGHRLELVIASSDADYRGTTTPVPVAVTSSATDPGTLQLPVAGRGSYGRVVLARAPRRG